MITKRMLLLCMLFSGGISSFLSAENSLPETKAYKLDLKIDFATSKIFGECNILLKNRTNQPIDKVPILLYRLLTVKSIINSESGQLPFVQKVVPVAGWEKLQVNYIEISLIKALSPGDEINIIIIYDGYLFGYSLEGWRYVKDNINRNFTIIRTDGFGYPVIGRPTESEMMAVVNERYNYEINITLQNGLKVVTGGELIKKTEGSDETIFSFRSKKPSWRIDVAISDYLKLDAGQNKVYFFKNDSLGARSMLDALEKSLKLYSEWFGEIKNFQGYTIVEVPEGYGSQQDITSFYITSDNFRKPEEMLSIYHEISHLWNVSSLDDQPCRLESEGSAQFLEFLMAKKLDNNKEAIPEAAQKYLNSIRKSFIEHPEYQNIQVRDYGIKNMTNYSYTLGMVLFAVLYDLTGQNEFNTIIRSFYSTYHSTGATLEEFISHCKRSSQVDLTKFFNDWIYSTNAIKYIIEGKTFNNIIQFYKEH